MKVFANKVHQSVLTYLEKQRGCAYGDCCMTNHVCTQCACATCKGMYLESLTSKGPAKTAFWRNPRTISSKLLGTRALIDMRLRNA